MFDELSARFEDAVKGLRGQDTISETNVDGALKDVRRALLEADVSLPVVKDFVAEVREKAVGAEVVRGVSPDQKFIQVVHEQLVEVMGGDNAPLAKAAEAPTVVLMAGLQGAGKTTATAKLGLHLKDQGRRALMVGADVYRPAAIEQLKTLGAQIDVEVFSLGAEAKPEDIAAAGLAKAKADGFDTLLVDTAGRLQIDTEMMEEMVRIRTAVQPDEVLLVVDSMIGQEAAELTRAFHDQVGITGAVLTKLDGDSRGGAALSIRKVSGQPIKFIGTGEKVEALQPFHPERMASRILGMGDVLTLVEKAQKEVELADVEKMQKKLQGLHLLAGADELDRLTAHLADREGGTTAGITIKLGEHRTGDPHLVVEGTGELGRLLADHRIHHQQYLIGLHSGADPHHLLHHLGVDLEAPCGVDQERVEAFLFRLGQTSGCNVFRLGLSTKAEDLHIDLRTERFQLLDGRWSVDVGPHHQGSAALILEMEAQLGRGRGLTGTLQASHQHDGGSLGCFGQRSVIATHDLHQLLMDHLDELLIRADPTHHFSADGFFADLSHEVLHHRQAHIRFQQRPADVLQRPIDVGLADGVLAPQPLNRILKTGGKLVEHRRHAPGSME